MKFIKVKQFLKSKKMVRIGACVLAAVVAAGGIGGYHVYAQKNSDENESEEMFSEKKEAEEENLLNQVLKTQTGRDDSGVEKEETVYVVADPDGTPNEVIVSDWLKNKSGADLIEDESNLTDIENVKGDETFTKGEDGEIIWQADGKDIYYQGKTSKELPVDLKLTYYLDGSEISPEDLAGKSGQVKIRVDYTNKEMADGVYVPFTAVTGMILNEDFTNIEVTNGKVISDGSKNVVVGFAFPGLSDSLNIGEDDLEGVKIPDYIEICADVTDFSLDMTLTFVMSDILQELDVDQKLDLSEIEEAIDALEDASGQLVDGSKELKNGTDQLKEGISAYTNGVLALKNGVDAYTDGVSQVKSGVDTYMNGVAKVAEGTQQLTDQSGSLTTGIQQLVTGASQVQTYFEGDNGLVKGSKAISEGINQLDHALNDGVTEAEKQQAAASVDAMFAADGETYQDIKQQAASQYEAAMKNSAELQSSVENGVGQAMYGAYEASYKQLNRENYAAAGKTEAELNVDAAAFAGQMVQASSSSISAVSGQLVSGIADGTSGMVGDSVAGACKSAALTGVETGISTTKSAIASQIEAGGLVNGANALSAGVNQLYVQGIQPLAQGMQTLNDNVPELMNGIRTLNDGAGALNRNGAALKNGLNSLNAKSGDLKNGASALNDSSAELNDGADRLTEGTKELCEGIVQFDEEGIQKLSNAYHGDVEKLMDRVDKVIDAGENYHTFSGLHEDMTGSVKFIIRTEEMK